MYCTCSCVCTYMNLQVYMLLADVRYLPQSLSTLLYEVESVTEPEILQFSSIGWPGSSKDPPCLHLSSVGI